VAKLTLSDLSSLANQSSAIATINANWALIETAIENTLSRDGTSPNAMSDSLDMNNERILNLPAPVADQEPLRLVDGQPLVDAAEDARDAALAALAEFQDIWLGNQTGDPSTDLDLSALEGGELYYNTVTKRLRVYSLGSGWVDVAPFDDLSDIVAYVAAAAASAAAALTSENNAEAAAAQTAADVVAVAAYTATATNAMNSAINARDAALVAETNAETAETNAETAQTAAELARDQAQLAYDSFDDRYLGEKNGPPLLDNDGNALLPGALYYDAGDSVLKYYNGTIWSTLSTAAGLNNVADDIDPELGNHLDLNSFNIVGTGNINITGDVSVTDEAYHATNWNGSVEVPTKNAVRDKIEEILGTTLPATYQPLDADLTALAALSTTGILSRTAANTYVPRTITGTANEVEVTNGDGVSGNPIIGLPNDVVVGTLDATSVTVDDDAYAAGWDGSVAVPTKNAVYDKIESVISDLNAHISDTSDAHDASAISFSPAGSIAATDVQAAIAELDTEKQPLDSDLTTIAGLTPSNDDIIQRKGGVWSNRTIAQLVTDISATNTYQPLDADLTAIAALTTAAYGRGLLESTSEADFKADVNLEIGVDVQAYKASNDKFAVGFMIDGAGATITTGVKGYFRIPWAATITKVSLLADQSGAIVLDLWKDTYANFPPLDADSITASALPTITASGTKSEDSTLTGWTTSVAAGDIIAVNVDSCTSHTRVTMTLEFTKT
jgi:hypothetical protein